DDSIRYFHVTGDQTCALPIGKPKGILHTSGGYLTQTAYTHHYVFDHKPGHDIYWCTADIGWVTGHSYIVYGPLANRTTQIVYEGTPNSPTEHRHFDIIEKYGDTIYYTTHKIRKDKSKRR